jgi:P4 family phage/plasmid primase-like protien
MIFIILILIVAIALPFVNNFISNIFNKIYYNILLYSGLLALNAINIPALGSGSCLFMSSVSSNNSSDNSSISKEASSNLPNIWDLADLFIKDNPFIKYCMSHKSYYHCKNNIWSIINKDQLTRLIIKFLKLKYPKQFKKFNLKSLDDFFLLISQHEEFSMPDAIANANSNGFLLPFRNGVLNTKTLEFDSHSPSNYTTHIIPVDYSKEDTIKDTKFAEFLTHIVNNNRMRLHILRACLYLIFTNNLIYQIALYIYGPGGTGKSTFISLLMYLLGKEVTLSSSISQVSSKFGVASIVGKFLVILNDVSLFRGQEPKNIKNIVTQDQMEAEQKYKQPFMFTPNCFIMLTSNVLWDIKNSTTGLARRMIYFPFDNVPKFKELDLFRVLPNGDAMGTLVPHLGGFINWVLTCPNEDRDLLYQGGSKITELISQDSIHINPLHVFVKDLLIPNEDSHVRIGTKETGNDTLYGVYCSWCYVNGINPISFKGFSILLLDLLKQQGWQISKKRLAIGFVVTGVDINDFWFDQLKKNDELQNNELEIVDTDPDKENNELGIVDTNYDKENNELGIIDTDFDNN